MATVLITAGPTREYLDAVRFLSNGSTGRMGFALARAAHRAGHEVHLVAGPTEVAPPTEVTVYPVVSALEMEAAVGQVIDRAHVVFGAAAVADERPAERHPGKPAKSGGPRSLEMVPNPDIIAGAASRPGVRAVVGFALEAPGDDGWEGILARGRSKLARKHLDAIAVNAPSALASDESEVVLVFADGREERMPMQTKDATAARLVAAGVELWEAKSREEQPGK